MQTLSSQKGVIKPPGKKKPPTEMDFRNKYKTEVSYFSFTAMVIYFNVLEVFDSLS